MSASFRRVLAQRLAQIAALAGPAATSITACHGGTCPTGPPTPACIGPGDAGPPLPNDAGGIEEDDAGMWVRGCPVGTEAEFAIVSSGFLDNSGFDAVSILSGPTDAGDRCCYVVEPFNFCGGRPFLVEDRPLVAPPLRGASGWSDMETPPPETSGLSADVRAELADAWTRDGLAEHASIASFARFSLELLAAGAPANLVALAHRAALDEVHHARLCLSLASAYAGAPVGPGAFPFANDLEVASDLATIAARAAREGCIGETLAAVHAAEQLARATDPAVRSALAIIAADEARHAELAWRTVAWAVRTGGPSVRAAVAAALAGLDGSEEDAPRREGPLDRHGRLTAGEQRRVAARALAEVVRPAARALLVRSAYAAWPRQLQEVPLADEPLLH